MARLIERLTATLQAITSQLIPDLANCTLSLRVIDQSPDGAGGRVETWRIPTGAGSVSAFVDALSVERAQRAYGLQTVGASEATCVLTPELAAVATQLRGAVVTAGSYAGFRFRVRGAIPNPTGGVLTLALESSNEAMEPPPSEPVQLLSPDGSPLTTPDGSPLVLLAA